MRAIAPADAAALVALWRETWTATYGPSLGAAALAAMLRGLDAGPQMMLPGHDERGYCLSDGDRIVASAIVAERGRVAYLWGMYVLPSQQRTGAGSRLLHALAADIRRADRLEARVVTSSLSAHAFYRKHGFRPIAVETTDIMADVAVPTSVLSADVADLARGRRG